MPRIFNPALAMKFRLPVLTLFTYSLLTACVSTSETKSAPSEGGEEITSELSIAQGDAAYQRGELDDAQVKYLLALNSEPENPETLYRIGTIYTAQGKNSLAEDSFRQALQYDEMHLNSSEALALLLLKKGRYVEAHKLFKNVVVQEKERWRTLNGLGVVYDMQKHHEQAQTFYHMALKHNPRSAQIHNNLGYSLYRSGDWGEVEEHFRFAISLQPNNQQAWSNLGLFYSRQGDFDASFDAFEKILNSYQAANNVGYLAMLQENLEVADTFLNMAIRLSPSYYSIAHDNLKRIKKLKK